MNEPKPTDVVLGGNSSSQVPINAAVLGGIEGVKRRLINGTDVERIAALSSALNYKEAGLALIWDILQNQTGSVQWAAYNLLWERASDNDKSRLRQYYPLKSARGVDYTNLRNLLAGGRWFDADLETRRVMLIAAKRELEGWFNIDLKNFPCSDLRTINQLWLDYSNGRFGFSVQKQIWLECGGIMYSESSKKLGDRVGWCVDNNWARDCNDTYSIRYSLDAPPGHLPAEWCRFYGQVGGWGCQWEDWVKGLEGLFYGSRLLRPELQSVAYKENAGA